MAEVLSAPARLTAADYKRIPDAGPRYELIDGELFMAPSPNLFRQEISSNIEHILRTYLEQQPIGRMFHAPLDVYLGELNVYQPDILFISTKHSQVLKEDGAPDLVVEILSPSTSRRDLGVKKRVLAGNGAIEFWAVHPIKHTVEVYRLRKSEPAPRDAWKEGDFFQSDLLPGLRVEVARFFVR